MRGGALAGAALSLQALHAIVVIAMGAYTSARLLNATRRTT